MGTPRCAHSHVSRRERDAAVGGAVAGRDTSSNPHWHGRGPRERRLGTATRTDTRAELEADGQGRLSVALHIALAGRRRAHKAGIFALAHAILGRLELVIAGQRTLAVRPTVKFVHVVRGPGTRERVREAAASGVEVGFLAFASADTRICHWLLAKHFPPQVGG